MTDATTTRTLDVPGATLTYDVRAGGPPDGAPLFLIGSPMAAAGFGTLSSHFADRTVVTYDPRGSERSSKADMTSPNTPEEHADDLHRIIRELGGGPVDMFASSGGAVNALALVAKDPTAVRTLVAHEPPATGVLPDRDEAIRASRDVHETYMRAGFGHGMAKFIAMVSHQGPFTADYLEQPAPDPAMFGLPTEDDGSRADPLLGQNMAGGAEWAPDFEALRTAPTKIVIAVGAESGEILPARAARIIAEQLGLTAVEFPGGHGGFLGGEYGQMGEPDAFAAKLRDVLAEA